MLDTKKAFKTSLTLSKAINPDHSSVQYFNRKNISLALWIFKQVGGVPVGNNCAPLLVT